MDIVLQVLCRFANVTRWSTNWYQKAKHKLTVYLHPFLSSLCSFHRSLVGTMPKSCFILEHQWPSASLRCGPVYNSSQPGSSLKNTRQKRPSTWFRNKTNKTPRWLFVHSLIDFQCVGSVTVSCVCLAVFSGHVRLP